MRRILLLLVCWVASAGDSLPATAPGGIRSHGPNGTGRSPERADVVDGLRSRRAPASLVRPPRSAPGRIESSALEAPQAGAAGTLFEAMPATTTGISLVYVFPTNAPLEYLQDQSCGAGVCLGDYDGDGLTDIFLTHYNRGNRLYRNLGHWQFADVTRAAGVEGDGRWCAGATFADVDNDSDLDLFVAVFNGPNLLYINQGDGTFKERATAWGLDFAGASVMGAFGDADRDGHLDLYLVTHRLVAGAEARLPRSSADAFRRSLVRIGPSRRPELNPLYADLFGLMNKAQGGVELIIAGQPDRFYRHTGQGAFRDATVEAGIAGHDIGLAAGWWDYNDDGWPDLYVSNDYKGPDRLYRNQGDGTFRDVASASLPYTPWASMSTDAADINNDGRIDLIASDMAGSTRTRRFLIDGDLDKERWFLQAAVPPQIRRNTVFLNTGTEHVLEVACLTGLARTDWTWSPKFGDFDNDGWVDLFVANGMSRDFVNADLLGQMKDRTSGSWRSRPVLREANLAFRNLGDLRFRSVGPEWGLDHVSASFGAATGDLDGDGDLDLVVANFDEPVSVYRNNGTRGQRVMVRLKGTVSNRWGLGAQIRIVTAAGVQVRSLTTASGFMSANEPRAHFGLGESSKIDELRVDWPSGHRQTFRDLEAGRLYTVAEPDAAPPRTPPPPSPLPPPPRFRRLPATPELRHRERPFDDFAREPLLPWKLSQLGPGLAVGDVDGDGHEDLYLGGAAGQPGTLCRREAGPRFQVTSQPAFDADRASEDMAAAFVDVDGDGDLDLFVVSGGVECEPGDPVLRDRLYLNDGRGHFTKAPGDTLPDERDAGSVVAAADFDRDGDLDLFAGGRSVPGHYLAVPNSRLLRNDRGRFADVTDAIAPGLRRVGMVTSALWSDANDDGWLDLLVTCDWGPVRLFLNRQGRLEDATVDAGLAARSGWWTGVAGRDLDGDGDIDYVVANFGLNTPYQPTLDNPVVALLGDFDASGHTQLLEATTERGALYPIRLRQGLTAVFPWLAEKVPSHASYAAATLPDLFAPTALAEALRVRVDTLESGVLLNDGAGHFTFRPLPRLAQTAPAFGVVLDELNGDTHPDLYLAQNFRGAQPETGPMAGGLSLLLDGNGDGTFTPVWPAASGLMVPEDARGVAVTDLDDDGWPDLWVGINDGAPIGFQNAAAGSNRVVSVRVAGRPGNPTGVGARVTATLADGSRQTAEICAGGGYLSQSTPALTFGLGRTGVVRQLTIRWPDGQTTTTTPPPGSLRLTVRPSD